jgi:mevalonate kinase
MITAHAPGSIMITGEHAVVYGHCAIVAAIDLRVTVSLMPREDHTVSVSSQIAPRMETTLTDLTSEGPYRFVLAALAHAELKRGCDIEIASEIDPTLGLGSSAAVTIATLGAVLAYAGRADDDIHTTACTIIQTLQGRGSGADLAASLHGGVIGYCAPPRTRIKVLPALPPVSLRYCGYKTPTSEVLKLVADRMKDRQDMFEKLYASMGKTADDAIAALQAKDHVALAKALNQYQTHMQTLGVSDETLDQIVTEARADTGVHAAKISGSGLGDCVLALGSVPTGFTPVSIAQKGLVVNA